MRLSPIPFNRIVAFAGPYISVASGALASWLLVHVHLLGLFHFGHDQLAKGIASGGVWALGTGVTWLGHAAWLKNHGIELTQGADEGPGDADALPHILTANPQNIPPDQGDPGAPAPQQVPAAQVATPVPTPPAPPAA